ncbi:hypothetical protein [Corallococcus sp. CA049B]|uniref:hypothetical protein n=1 Tax=Corallococcus sp. CA049B TaxID=2316730 RepID=UPI0011C3A203|nr:hypothetical protein [Corallococcus sp. CA049B]
MPTSPDTLLRLMHSGTRPAPSTPRTHRGHASIPKDLRPVARLPSPKQLAWLCLQPRAASLIDDHAQSFFNNGVPGNKGDVRLFSQVDGTAYGILRDRPRGARTRKPGERSQSTPLSRIFEDLNCKNEKTGLTF